ncbi:MAG: N-carbamoylputrescine amidase [Azospirillaceae bacterium]
MPKLTVAVTQMACTPDTEDNQDRAEALVRRAAALGADLVLLQEFFATPYFCKDQLQAHFSSAAPADDHPVIERFSRLAAELGVVLPISFFEQKNNAYYNSLAMVDRDGSLKGLYRKSHIPDGPGYQEKFYFNPGDTGLRVFDTAAGRIGCAICWDQWFPEAARVLALKGADLIIYPTAIGSEPQDPTLDSRDHWTRVMQGHAAANMVPVLAANRTGTETGQSCTLTFYGSSFIAGPTGELLARADREGEAVLTAFFDTDDIRAARASWGLFRDRRPDLYGAIATLDGG